MHNTSNILKYVEYSRVRRVEISLFAYLVCTAKTGFVGLNLICLLLAKFAQEREPG
jgi:hypothetical protein